METINETINKSSTKIWSTHTLLASAGVGGVVAIVVWFVISSIGSFASTNAYGAPAFCNVALIELHGPLVTYDISLDSGLPSDSSLSGDELQSAEFFNGFTNTTRTLEEIRIVSEDPSFAAIIIEIDSPGGSPVAGEEVAEALKHAGKPTIALIRQEATSAGYLAATGAEIIFAHRGSDVGSIGVSMSYFDTQEKDKKDGYKYVSLHAGKYKEILNPSVPLTKEALTILENYLDKSHRDFIEQIASNRNLPVDHVTILADGMVMLGTDAREAGLIDNIGSMHDVRVYLANILNLRDAADVIECTIASTF